MLYWATKIFLQSNPKAVLQATIEDGTMIDRLTSTKMSFVLFILAILAMAVATFIENDYGTAVVRNLVYEAVWFEIILAWLGINFLFHIKQYNLFSKQKLAVGLFHIAFVIIIFGAGVTRYTSNEGVIHIREGQTQKTFFTAEHYLQITSEDHKHASVRKEFIPTVFKADSYPISIDGQAFIFKAEAYIKGARQGYDDGNETLIDITYLDNNVRNDVTLNPNDQVKINGSILSFKESPDAQIQIYKKDSIWMINSVFPMELMQMSTQNISSQQANKLVPLQIRAVYQWEGGSFVIRNIMENVQAILEPEPDPKLAKDLLDGVKISVWNDKDEIIKTGYFYKLNRDPQWLDFEYDGKKYKYTYGPQAKLLPFALYLDDFQLERYPGSTSPSSYASEVIVKDSGEEYPFRIFMNNVLDHGGYRFYQSSYDTDEKGTVLAINQDRPGTIITYFGYFLLTLGMCWTLFARGSRFHFILKKLGKLSATAAILLALLPLDAKAQQLQAPQWHVPEEIAAKYGRLIVQDLDGRMKPMNTLANEIVRKVHGKSRVGFTYKEVNVSLSSEQFVLAMQLAPQEMSTIHVIKVDKKKVASIFETLNHEPVDYLSFNDFINEEGDYKLLPFVEEANKLKPSERSEYHNEILKVDERFNIFYGLIIGDFLRIFPNRFDSNNTWYTAKQSHNGFDEEDGRFVEHISGMYMAGLRKGINGGGWASADSVFAYIDLYQKKAGKNVYPSDNRIEAELLYNKLNLGNRLFGLFWILGLILLIVTIIELFKSGKILALISKIGGYLALLGWLAFTTHLTIRWYIAEHPPWSDGFEMLVFVAWGVLLFGLVFAKKSKFTIPLALLFSGTLLFVSFLDWLNPEITNLMPVLNSYWLKIHVAVIVSGYAPLALSAILGLMSLLLLIFKPKNPENSWWNAQKELIAVNELSITVGLFLLAIGTFLGGVWANESWGRYWAWDPKETWALISVLVYTVILHLRLVPITRSAIVYTLTSLWGFSSIIMTSFGVNYYLSGLHSYAQGDPVPIPGWVYWATAILLVISILGTINYRKLDKAEKRRLII